MSTSSPFLRTLLLHWQWTLAGVTALLCIIGIGLLWVPEYSRMQQFDPKELVAKEQERQDLARSADELRAVKKGFDALDPAGRAQIMALLPPATSFTHLLTMIRNTSAQAGFSVETFSVQDAKDMNIPESKGSARRVLMQVRLAGRGYEQWKSFLASLERQLPVTDLVTSQFKPESAFQDFSLVTYIFP